MSSWLARPGIQSSTLSVALAIGLFLSGTPWAGALVLAVGALLVIDAPIRVLLGMLSVGLAFHVPWALLALMAGLGWLLVDRRLGHGTPIRKNVHARLRLSLTTGSLAGLIAGLLAIPFLIVELESAPVAFAFAKPHWIAAAALIVVLAAINSTGEEIIWRGALSKAASSLPATTRYMLQIFSFGLAHFDGIPGGLFGMVLTGFFAAIATALRERFGGVAAISAHFVADVVLFSVYFMLADSFFVSVSQAQ